MVLINSPEPAQAVAGRKVNAMKSRFDEIEKTLYTLASLYEAEALKACEARDTGAVHFFVTEARKAGTMPRNLKMRFGDNA